MKNELSDRETSSMIVPVLLSGAIGAGLALLLTPKSGKEIRNDIGRMASRGNPEAEPLEATKVTLNEAVRTGQESIAETKEQLTDFAEDVYTALPGSAHSGKRSYRSGSGAPVRS